jgi:hypothetical protein
MNDAHRPPRPDRLSARANTTDVRLSRAAVLMGSMANLPEPRHLAPILPCPILSLLDKKV